MSIGLTDQLGQTRPDMQTKADVEAAFRAELMALLEKYNAELEAKDHYEGYAECGEDVRMTVTVPAIWDANHDIQREWTEIDLGSWLCGVRPNAGGNPRERSAAK